MEFRRKRFEHNLDAASKATVDEVRMEHGDVKKLLREQAHPLDAIGEVRMDHGDVKKLLYEKARPLFETKEKRDGFIESLKGEKELSETKLHGNTANETRFGENMGIEATSYQHQRAIILIVLLQEYSIFQIFTNQAIMLFSKTQGLVQGIINRLQNRPLDSLSEAELKSIILSFNDHDKELGYIIADAITLNRGFAEAYNRFSTNLSQKIQTSAYVKEHLGDILTKSIQTFESDEKWFKSFEKEILRDFLQESIHIVHSYAQVNFAANSQDIQKQLVKLLRNLVELHQRLETYLATMDNTNSVYSKAMSYIDTVRKKLLAR